MPLITPVEESMLKPAGSAGEISQRVIVPPSELGEAGLIPVPLVSTSELGLYSTSDGITSLTSRVIVVLSAPPVLVAVIV